MGVNTSCLLKNSILKLVNLWGLLLIRTGNLAENHYVVAKANCNFNEKTRWKSKLSDAPECGENSHENDTVSVYHSSWDAEDWWASSTQHSTSRWHGARLFCVQKGKNPMNSSPARGNFLLFSSVGFVSAEVCIKLCVFNSFSCCLLPGKCLACFGNCKWIILQWNLVKLHYQLDCSLRGVSQVRGKVRSSPLWSPASLVIWDSAVSSGYAPLASLLEEGRPIAWSAK